MRAGRWEVLVSTNICGKTLGIVGLGRIGKAVARRARGFDMTVLATDLVQDDAFTRQYDVTYLPLPELLRCADIVSINAPLSRETRHLIDDQALRRMKPTAFPINTARGGLVDEEALRSSSPIITGMANLHASDQIPMKLGRHDTGLDKVLSEGRMHGTMP